MLKVIFLSIFTFVLLSATAQVQTQVIGDSVFVHNNMGRSQIGASSWGGTRYMPMVLKELIEKQQKPLPTRNKIGFKNYD
ncbi:MAG TPA: hypothetical protein VIJ95_14635 [Hanamia sp.]